MLVLNPVDKNIVFINFETLKDLHSHLLEKLHKAIIGGLGRTSRVCAVYDSFKQQMMKGYVDYFGRIQKSIAKVKTLSVKCIEFQNKLTECRKKSELGVFELPDLIRIPYQRVLKYHLLFIELLNNTQQTHPAIKNVKQTYENMMEVAYYLNQSQHDQEILDHIDEISLNLRGFNFNSTTLKDFGHLIKDDNVRIKQIGETFAKTRTLLLFDKAIFICKSRGDIYDYRGTIMLNEYKIQNYYHSRSSSSEEWKKDNQATQLNLLQNSDRTKGYSLLFKDQKQKADWKSKIESSIGKLEPYGFNSNDHMFTLFNFNREIICCSLCQKTLLGILFQGYKCKRCLSIAHKDCIMKYQKCSSRNRAMSVIMNNMTKENNNIPTTRFVSFRVRALYSYNGTPQPPENGCLILKFKDGDIIQVTDDDDNDWWKGYKVEAKTTIEEGFFQKVMLK